MVSHVDLCSGIGGFSLGFRWAGLSENPYLLCDFEPWCRDILRKNFPGVPIADDVKEIASDPARFIPGDIPRPYILTAGYPCQPFSQAGRRLGKEDPRHIYPYISSIVSFTRPDVVVFENVYGHVSLGLDEVLHDLEAKDYDARTFVFPSAAIVGLPHQRNRLWIISKSKSIGHGGWDSEECGTEERIVLKSEQTRSTMGSKAKGCGKLSGNVSDSKSGDRNGNETDGEHGKAQTQKIFRDGNGLPDTQREHANKRADKSIFIGGLGRVVDGIPSWMDEPNIPRVTAEQADRTNRLKGLGNAIVPQIAMLIGMTIKKELTK
jgi:DNA (cytosine-5)-methyltransferase 1